MHVVQCKLAAVAEDVDAFKEQRQGNEPKILPWQHQCRPQRIHRSDPVSHQLQDGHYYNEHLLRAGDDVRFISNADLDCAFIIMRRAEIKLRVD